MTKFFQNGEFQEFRAAVENKKAVLILVQNDKTSFGLLIVDPIEFSFEDRWSSSSLISTFNIIDRKEFRGKGEVKVWDWGKIGGQVNIGNNEVAIDVNGKGYYDAYSTSGGEILQITEDDDGINAITKEEGSRFAYFDYLEVYA